MQILFIDESGTPPPLKNVTDSPLFILGGVIIPEDIWHYIKMDLEGVKKKYHISGEIKWRYFAPHNKEKKNYSLSHLTPEEKENVRSALFLILQKYKSIKTICVITDAAKAYNLPYIQTPDALYWYSYKQMTERFQYYLQDISRICGQTINGVIVCDHRAPKDDKRLQELHAKLLLGHHDAHSNYSRLIEGLFIAPSHFSIGIQFADLVAGATLRSKKGDHRFFDQISSTLRRSTTGKVEGYGLIHFPKD